VDSGYARDVTYRDDHDAALERVTALETELDRARADDVDQAAKIAQLSRDLEAARAERARVEDELARLRPPPAREPAPASASVAASAHTNDPAMRFAILGVVVAGIILVIIAMSSQPSSSADGSREPAMRPEPPLQEIKARRDPASTAIEDAIARAKQRLPGGFLSKIELTYVDENGVVYSEYQGSIRVSFAQPLPPPPPPPPRPIGAPPVLDTPRSTHECFMVSISGGTTQEYDGDMCEMMDLALTISRRAPEPAAPPKCTPSAIWQLALLRGAPKGALAQIEYDGRWDFEIRDARAPFSVSFADDCTR